MKILYLLNKEPDATAKKIIELHKKSNEVKTIELFKGGVSYEKMLEDVFAYDKVFCW